ncbi:hypothetical protein VNO78_25873 [Psophocarpus tetragonolobus]|uniref:Uncharacterized protein n=1 Tax=Psophocarpus tetragonolobus TaxID=3891 RepID=A0AAN9SAJ0_PSOTE
MKGAPIPILMGFVVILLHAYISNADSMKINDTTTICDGYSPDCLIGRHVEPVFPTITTSHFGRMLAGGDSRHTGGTADPNNAACKIYDGRYRDCSPPQNGKPNSADHCSDPYFKGSDCTS